MPTSDQPTQIRGQRTFLIMMSTMLVIFGLVTWTDPVPFNPMVARLVLAGLGFGLVGLSYLDDRLAQRFHLAIQAVGHLAWMWFCFVSAMNDLGRDHAFGLLPLCIIPALFTRTWREATVNLVVIVGGMLAQAWSVENPGFDPFVLGLLTTSMSFGTSIQTLYRARLEEALATANTELEQRVTERTADLARSLEVVESEARERARAERIALRASRAKSTFLANMSHELRTPLNAIVGYTEMVVDELPPEHAEQIEDLGRVEAAARHLLGLIDSVLDLARVEAEELDLRIEAVDLAAVVDDALLLLPSFSEDVVLHNEVDHLFVTADASRLRQVIVNLLSNAQKFTPNGTITLRQREGAGRVLLDVIDTGIGIAPDDLDRVFDRFVQSNGQEEGAGLGLAICRMLVDQMGGQITVTSRPGHGSTFTIGLARGLQTES